LEKAEIPATSTGSPISTQQEEALWFAYLDILEKHKELITFAKSVGVYEFYEPRQQYYTTH